MECSDIFVHSLYTEVVGIETSNQGVMEYSPVKTENYHDVNYVVIAGTADCHVTTKA